MKRLYRSAVRALLLIMVCRGQALVATVPPSFSEPNSSTNHDVYIHYTATTPFTHKRVSRFVANGNVAVAGRTNVALASAGAMAVGSSTVNGSFPASAAINGDRKGVGWGAGGGWNDGTPSVFPDWLEVDFNGTHTIDEIDVFTLQDNYASPSDPTAAMTFTGYGLRDFDAQYWNGSSWQTVAGGQITGNNNVWRTIAFTAVTTTRIRVYVTDALAGYSRIVEVEAYESTGPADTPPTVMLTNPTEGSSFAASTPIIVQATAGDTDGTVTRVDFYANGTLVGSDTTSPYAVTWTPSVAGPYTLTAVATDNLDVTTTSAAVHVTITGTGGVRTNVALASNGAVAVASSTANSGFAASAAINADRKGVGWGAGGGWNDGTPSVFPDWLEVDFNGTYAIDEIDVFTLQDNYGAPSDPTPAMTFTGYGLRDFDAQYWNGSSWQTVANGHITGNTNVWRTIAFTAVTTTRIRVWVTDALAGYSRIVEVEAYQSAGPANTPPTVGLTSPADGASVAVSTPVGLAATANDADGTVTRVDFYANGTLVGTDATSPYAATWTPSVAGPYTLTAVATDNLNAPTTSAAVQVTVTTGSGGRTNVALASAGAVAVVSSMANSNYPASAATNGDRRGVGWGAGGGWNDGTPSVFPDWLEVDFNGTFAIDEIDVFTLQDNYSAPSDPTPTMTFASYGLRDFDAQYWNGSSWQTVANGHITSNTNVWRTIAFPAVSTNRIRILVTNALAGYSRIVEVEAYSGGVPDTQPPVVTNLQPVDGSMVSGPVTLGVTATDDRGVAGVQFQVDGVNVGSEDQAAPYGATWDSFSASNGTHVVTAVARDGAGNMASVSATVTVSNTLTTFPLRVGTDLRHLVDQGDVPFLVNGDAAWSLIVGLQKPDASVYLADRRAKGFNTLLVNLIEHRFSVDPPRNAYGDGPFTTPGDFSTPNEPYFAHADWVINEAASRGMLVLLTPAYLGYGCGGEGWCQEMNANGTAKMFNYGVYLGNRYKNFKNILWVHGGDTNANAYAGTGNIVRAVINGIKSVDGPRVHTSHCNRETSALDCYDEAWLDVNTTYSACSTSALRTRTDYNRARMMPFFYIEGTYENEGASDVCLRSQAYWSILGGSSGHVFGNNPIWPFTGPAWQQALNSTGAQSMANAGALFRSRAWQTLVPDYLHQVVTAGYGNINNATYVSAARAGDGSMAIAYLPGGGTITVDMSRLSRSATARWYDPVAGTFTAIAGSPFANTGSRNFTTPGTNAGGSVDWVLVLEITP